MAAFEVDRHRSATLASPSLVHSCRPVATLLCHGEALVGFSAASPRLAQGCHVRRLIVLRASGKTARANVLCIKLAPHSQRRAVK